MAITLYQFKPALGLPNASPFCMKLEMYLRMARLEYKTVTLRGRPRSSTRKAPYVDLDGAQLTDSGLIIAQLERKFGNRVDGRLTLAQRAEALAVQRMMEEHLSWVILYGRWLDPDTRADSDAFIADMTGMPRVLVAPLAGLIRRGMRRELYGHGLGRHEPAVLWQMGITDVSALGHWLGSKAYAFGDTPTVTDACMASFIGGIARGWSNPLRAATLKYGNLIAHFERMMVAYFPEYQLANRDACP